MKSVSVGGALVCVSDSWCLWAQSVNTGEQIENEFLTVRFDTTSGQIQVERKNAPPLLRNAIARAALADGIRATSDPEYHRSSSVRPFQDALGKGRQISARCIDRRKQVDFEVLLTLYDGRNALVVEVTCRNPSKKDARLARIEPVRAVLEEGSYCGWAEASKALTNGYMYPDPGRVEELGQSNRHAITSMWNMGFYRGAQEEGLVVGYLENKVATGRISAMYDRTVLPLRSHGGLSLITESLYGVDYVLKAGASTTSERLIFNIAADPFTALEAYAQAMADVHQVHLNPIINGWCSWFYSHEYINEEEVLRNTEFAARALKAYGLEYVQIDSGWFRTYGEWEGNQNFPHGMKWLAGKIRDWGLRAGIWLAPYCIAEGTDVFATHRDWLLTDSEGQVKQCGGGLSSPQAGPYGIPSLMKKIYGLDVTHPGAAGWLRELFKKVSEDWGYDFIKIDFVEWTLLSAERYHDRTCSQAAAYRKGFELIRDAIGPKRHLLDCGPMNNTVEWLDSARIEQDLPRLTWEQYTGNFNSSAPAMAKRYYFNQKTWINDADHLGLALLTLAQSRAAASIIALSGGTMISGDRLVDLDPDRLEILRKVYPSYGVAGRPIDLFEADRPEIFEIPIKTKFAEWSVVALFNYADAFIEKSVTLERLRLPESKTYLAFEFWSQRLVGEFDRELRVRVEPESVALLSVHPIAGVPRVMSTDRHFTQGAVELKNVNWNTSSNMLSGTSVGAAGTAHNISIYVPREYRWDSDLPEYFHESGQYSLKQTNSRILRVRARFDAGTVTPWQVQFARIY
jgi:hypothetical protein